MAAHEKHCGESIRESEKPQSRAHTLGQSPEPVITGFRTLHTHITAKQKQKFFNFTFIVSVGKCRKSRICRNIL